MKKYNVYFVILFLSCFTLSCKKQLDAKPDQKLATIEKLSDLQAILDYDPNMVIDMANIESSADNYYITDADYDALSDGNNRRIYTWYPDHLFTGAFSDWGNAYRKIYYANTVLDALQEMEINPGEAATRDNIQGQALFIRGMMFWKIANAWAPAYNEATSGTDMGIPLRLSADFNERSVRASVTDSYMQAIADLRLSASLLPIQPWQVVRGSRPAAFAFLSRVYLSMRQYDAAGRYADSCLQLYNKLVDYNTLNPGDAYPIARFNDETLVYSYTGPTLITTPVGKVDSLLYQSYDNTDLRKTVFFKDNGAGRFGFKGSYSNSQGFFAGVATDEVYLNRAECYARSGNIPAALADLNTLLQKRYKTGQFIPVTATSSAAALAKILIERRKELLFRFIRWMDLKRFNLEGANITLTRVVHGTVYTLSPNDLRYALPIPEDIIALTGMPQNPR